MVYNIILNQLKRLYFLCSLYFWDSHIGLWYLLGWCILAFYMVMEFGNIYVATLYVGKRKLWTTVVVANYYYENHINASPLIPCLGHQHKTKKYVSKLFSDFNCTLENNSIFMAWKNVTPLVLMQTSPSLSLLSNKQYKI